MCCGTRLVPREVAGDFECGTEVWRDLLSHGFERETSMRYGVVPDWCQGKWQEILYHTVL